MSGRRASLTLRLTTWLPVRRAARSVGGVALAAAAAWPIACARTAVPPSVPDTPAGRAFRAWFYAYNAADSASLAAYGRAYDPGMSVHTQLEFRAQTGPYALASVERSDPRNLEVTLRTKSESTVGLIPLTMDAVVHVADALARGGPPRGTPDDRRRRGTTITLLGMGSWAPVLRIGAAERAVAVESVAAKVGRNYVLPEVARRVADSLRARQARGAYDVATQIGFARRLDGDLRALGGDPQLGVEYAWRPVPTPTPPALLHCGFEPARVLAGGVGYVTFYGLRDPAFDCGHAVSGAMQAVADARALIIDLREVESGGEREGGSLAMTAYLASYLVAGCTHLGDLWDRRMGRIEPLRTHDGLPGPVFGRTKPLVLLTSARTASAAEALAYALQRAGRATVVGDTTAGSARVTAVGPVGPHLLVRVPVARVLDPVTGADWQGVGVVPDVGVPADEALGTAYRLIREGRVPQPSPMSDALRGAAASSDGVSSDGVPAGPPAGVPGRHTGRLQPLRGVRFAVDTLGPGASQSGVLSRVAGVVEFAGGRGRFDVTAVRHVPAVARNGVAIAEPLARPGDYYLFDNAGGILVQPATRTFSTFAFTRADYNHTGMFLPGLFNFGVMRTIAPTDTLAAADVLLRRQHAPVSFHWHMQPPSGGTPAALYARGWLEVADAPAVEAGVVRWFEVAAALATRAAGVQPMARDGLEVTSVVLLRRPGTRAHAVTYVEELAPHHLAATDVDPARLVLPAGYRATRWPGFERAPDVPAPSSRAGARWHALEDESSQRARAACAQAWLPEPQRATR